MLLYEVKIILDFIQEKMVNEDRLSSLPDEILVQILSCMNTKYAVQTSLVSPRWKLLWTLVPCLNFSSKKFDSLHNFSEFVNNVLSRRNHEIHLSSVKLNFEGSANHDFVRNIANYAFSHNVQNITLINPVEFICEFPSCLFSSKSLKHLAFRASFLPICCTPITPWDFPALITMHLSDIALCTSKEPVDIFSKCVNLKNLTLESFFVMGVEVFDIISPRLTNLILTIGKISSNVVNVIAPQLESLEIYYCPIKYLNVPAGVSSFRYWGHHPPQLPKDHFHSLNKVMVNLNCHCTNTGYEEGDAIEIINMFQELRSARYLTLNLVMVECLSSFPNLVSHLPSPFSNLICVKIDSDKLYESKVEFSSEVRKFLIDNSPNATFIMEKPEMLSMAAKEFIMRNIRRPRLVKQVGVMRIRSKESKHH